MTMSMNKRPRLAVRLLRIFCATLMLSLGFAHKPLPAMAGAAVERFEETYRLPDGSFAEICENHAGALASTHGGGKTGHPDVPSLICEACLLASSILLPTPDSESWARAHFTWLLNKPTLDISIAHATVDPRPRARAPPILA